MRFIALPFLLVAFATLAPGHANAAQVFACGEAAVRIEVLTRNSPIREERAEAVITVALKGAETVLRYRFLDFIGGQCLTEGVARPYIVFQAYCGGSSCQDLENWGAIDPQTLRVLAVPREANRLEVQKMLGAPSLPTLKMMSIEAP